MRLRVWSLTTIVLIVLSGCGQTTAANDQQLTVTGSTSVTPFAEQLAEEFEQQYPNSTVNIQGLGSSAGIQAAENGTVEIGMSSRDLEPDEEQQLTAVEIARDALAIIVHPSNPLTNLSSEQVRAIFTGSVRNWQQFNGQNAPIVVVTREAGSGTYGAFEELVMQQALPASSALRQGSNGAVREIVAEDPYAIGYISLGIVDQSVKAIAIDGVKAARETVGSGQYKLVRPFLFVHRKNTPLSPLAQTFLQYVLSPQGQNALVQAGLIQGADAQ